MHDQGNPVFRLAALLDEEDAGRPVDPRTAIQLAEAVMYQVPEMLPVLHGLMRRMRGRRNA